MKRYLAAVSAALLLVAVVAPAAMAKSTKTSICHYNVVTDSYSLTSVPAGKPLQAHLAHGDAYPGDPVPTMPDYEFGAGCSVVAVDVDLDGVAGAADNCPSVANPGQSNRYGSAKGDACEDDSNGDGTLDANEASICVSSDGAVVVAARGGAGCSSDLTSGSQPNIAVAHGDGSYAYAAIGDNNTAIAEGDGTNAYAATGDNNAAIAEGVYTYASVSEGDGNTATATGFGAVATTGYGNNNTATATGVGAAAYVTDGDNNTAIADGDSAFAYAATGDNNTATATGVNAYAVAMDGDNNTAIADGDGAIAYATALLGCTVTNGTCS